MSFVDEVRSGWESSYKPGSSLTDDMYRWGRQTFAKSYAVGGATSKIFSPGGRGLSRTRIGSRKYNARLESIRAEAAASGRTGTVSKIDEALGQSRAGKPKGLGGRMGKGMRVGGGALNVAFVALPAFLEGDTVREKTQAVAGGIASSVGWTVGAKAGAAAGAAIGSAVPVVGTAIGLVAGAIVGGIAGSSVGYAASDASFGYFDSRVEKSKAARRFGWKGDTSAFNTQQAYTMRSASLQMMNKGMLSARSGLGHEGVMLHR